MKKMIQRIRDRRRDRARRKMNRGASFLKTFAVATLVISALLIVLLALMVSEDKKDCTEYAQNRMEECRLEVYILGDDYDSWEGNFYDIKKQNPEFQTWKLYQCIDPVSMNTMLKNQCGENAWWCIYDKTNQTILFDSTQRRYLINIEYQRIGHMYSLNVCYRLNDGQIALMEEYPEVSGSVQLTITSAYLKGDEILIGSYITNYDQVEHQCDLSEYFLQSYRYVKLEREETIDEYGETETLYVGNDCGIKISMDSESAINRIGGYKATPQLMKKAQKYFQESKDKVVIEKDTPGFSKSEQTKKGYFYPHYDYLSDSDTYRVLAVCTEDGEVEFYQNILRDLFLIVLFSMIVSVFIAVTRYLRSKQTREVYVYRNTLNTAMAHDLKTPLMAISGYTENIAEDVNPDKREHYVDGIANQVDYMNKMIDGILELAKAEETTSDEKVQINLKSLTETVIENLKEELEKRKLTVQVTGTGIVRANRQSMETVIRNLIENACKYAPEGGTVTVAVSNKRYSVTNELTENITVAPEKLLEPFTKGDTSRSGRKGTGLGLAIVKNICDEHGFQVRLKTGDGKFCIEIVFA